MEYPFSDSPNTAVIACCHIVEDRLPILYVTHDEEDGSWQFLCGKSHEMDDARVVSLKSVFDLDSSIGALANMPCGYCATREKIEDDWTISKY